MIAGLLIALVYAIVGPLLLVIWLRLALWIGAAAGLDDDLGRFVAKARRSFDAYSRPLSREMGETP